MVPPSGEDSRTRLVGTGSHQSHQMQQRRRHSEKKQERKAAKTLSAILLAFIITWTPYNVLIIVKAFTTVDTDLYSFGEYISAG
jgi:muscarinic acetylcholine receptor M3